ncbi:MAG: heavy metal-binding domain-containing protein [Gemmataceae bacterium]
MSTTTNTRLGALLLLVSSGCVGPVEIAPLPYAHPANPDAPAGAVSSVGSMLGPTEGDNPTDGAMTGMTMSHDMGGMKMPADHGDKMGDRKADATAGKYQCPMHSQVHSDKPGKCPICGMRMVKNGNAPKPQEDHER